MPPSSSPAADRGAVGPGWLGGTARLCIGGVGLLILGLAAAMDRQWAEHRLLPDILVPSDWLMTIVQVERLILALIGAALILAAVRMKAPPRAPLRWVGIFAAVLLALPASEWAMQIASGRSGQAWTPSDEPLRRADPLAGWSFIPSRRAVDSEFAARPVYVIDSHGYRVPDGKRALDWNAPSILFAGESIMFGKGLDWRDTVAGKVERLSGIQSANLAVTAYSAGQTFLRLKRELPRFRRPLAVVILFGPTLLVRDLDRNRPWFDSAGRLHPVEKGWYLSRLGRVIFPYRSPSAIDEAIAADQRLLIADVAMARARGARPIIVVPVFQPEQPRERALRAAIFDGADIPHLVVPLDQRWRLRPDFHPDARAHAAMARALWTRLRHEKIARP